MEGRGRSQYCGGVGTQMEPWRVYTPMVADSHQFDENPHPHLREKSGSGTAKSEKRDPDRVKVMRIRNPVKSFVGANIIAIGSGGKSRRVT
jgi:hypothetical protein